MWNCYSIIFRTFTEPTTIQTLYKRTTWLLAWSLPSCRGAMLHRFWLTTDIYPPNYTKLVCTADWSRLGCVNAMPVHATFDSPFRYFLEHSPVVTVEAWLFLPRDSTKLEWALLLRFPMQTRTHKFCGISSGLSCCQAGSSFSTGFVSQRPLLLPRRVTTQSKTSHSCLS